MLKKHSKRLHVELLEERRLLALTFNVVPAYVEYAGVSIYATYKGWDIRNGQWGLQEHIDQDGHATQPTPPGPSSSGSVSFGDHRFTEGETDWAHGSASASYSASASSTHTVDVTDEGNGITRYTISMSSVGSYASSLTFDPKPVPPLTIDTQFRYYLQDARLIPTGSLVSGSVIYTLTSPADEVLSDTTQDRVGSWGRYVPSSGSAAYSESYTRIIRVATRYSLSSVDFTASVPILPDQGTNGSNLLFNPGRKDYEDVDRDGVAEQQHPILFAANSVPAVTSEFKLTGVTGNYRLRGTGPDGFVFSSNTPILTSDGLRFENVLANKAFGPQIKKYDEFSIEWELSPNGGTSWQSAGSSRNTLYVSGGAPLQLVDALYPDLEGIYETIVDVAITRNIGRTAVDRLGIIEGTWTYFDMNASNDATRIDGTPLSYWGKGYDSDGAQLTGNSVSWFLLTTDGTCGSWTNFFLDVLAVNGVLPNALAGEGEVTVESPFSKSRQETLMEQGTIPQAQVVEWEDLVINRISLDPARARNKKNTDYYTWSSPMGPVKYPYFFQEDPDEPISVLAFGPSGPKREYLSDVTHLDGLPAQNNLNPIDTFNNHALVLFDEWIFDPSYGTRYRTLAEWEDAALGGFFYTTNGAEQFASSDGTLYLGFQRFYREQRRGMQDLVATISPGSYHSYASNTVTLESSNELRNEVVGAGMSDSQLRGDLDLIAGVSFEMPIGQSFAVGSYGSFERLASASPAMNSPSLLEAGRSHSDAQVRPQQSGPTLMNAGPLEFQQNDDEKTLAFEELLYEWEHFMPLDGHDLNELF